MYKFNLGATNLSYEEKLRNVAHNIECIEFDKKNEARKAESYFLIFAIRWANMGPKKRHTKCRNKITV